MKYSLYVEPGRLPFAASKVKGSSEDPWSTNQYLDSLKQKVYNYQRTVTQAGKPFTKNALLEKWHVIEEHAHSLMGVFTKMSY